MKDIATMLIFVERMVSIVCVTSTATSVFCQLLEEMVIVDFRLVL